jgi:hypothetical protein
MWDRDFCGSQHRAEAVRLSARALKDSEFGLVQEFWVTPKKQQKTSFGQIALLGGVMASVILVGMSLSGGGGQPTRARNANPSSPLVKTAPGSGSFSDLLSDVLPKESEITRVEDFGRGARDWVGSIQKDDWNFSNGLIRPGSIRLWTRSLPLTDYRFVFEGSIQRSAMSWAYRANDTNHYYSSKLRLVEGNRVEVVRSIFEGGREVARLALPVPVKVNINRPFRVAMAIDGEQFVTFVDGQQVDEWKDSRYKTGGIGFYAQSGEAASLSWVSVTDTTHALWRTPLAGLVVIAPPISLD